MPGGSQLSNLALEKLRQEDCQKFKTSLGYTGRHWLILTQASKELKDKNHQECVSAFSNKKIKTKT